MCIKKTILGHNGVILNKECSAEAIMTTECDCDVILTFFLYGSSVVFRIYSNPNKDFKSKLLNMTKSYNGVMVGECVEFMCPVATFNLNYLFKYGLLDRNHMPLPRV